MINEDNYPKLIKYFKYLKSAKYSRNVMLPYTDCVKILTLVYGEHWQDSVPKTFSSCGKCKLETLTKICTQIEEYERTIG